MSVATTTKEVVVETVGVGLTDVGRVRSVNQDSFLVDNTRQLFVVADGMGGHAGGEIASKLCVEGVSSFIDQHLAPQALTPGKASPGSHVWQHPDGRISNVIAESVNHASTRIYERALEEPELKGMGTTATVLKIVGNCGYCAHVGDSRMYLLRAGFIYQITNDHSLVSEQVRAGLLTKEEAELHHLRNVITRSVGYQEEEDVDTTTVELEDDDLILMCSDGLHGKVSDKELATITADLGVDAPANLVALANERGGDDNITVVVVRIKLTR